MENSFTAILPNLADTIKSIKLLGDNIQDWNGNIMADSMKQISISRYEEEEILIGGNILGTVQYAGKAPLMVEAHNINNNEDKKSKNPMYFVNPEIVWKSEDKFTYEEGCLSVPNQFAEIDRPKQCHVRHLDYNGDPQELKAEGLLATCIQHEIDHLEGILFIDYLSKLKKSMIIKKLSKQKNKVDRIVV